MATLGNMFNLSFGNIRGDMCRLSLDGNIAIHTSSGYKTYDVESGTCVNCDNFVFGDNNNNFFFVLPTNKVERGDIIIASGKPRCVIEIGTEGIKTFCYEDSSITTIVPERRLFLGKSYLYGKIVSLFGNGKDAASSKNLMKFMLMSQMMGGSTTMRDANTSSMNPMMLMMMMNGNMFDDMLNFSLFDEEEEKEQK